MNTDRIAVFDVETTGVNPIEDRIVSAFFGILRDGEWEYQRSWLVDPGIPIPAGAAEVHGISTERAREYGLPPDVAIGQILQSIEDACEDENIPLVAYNAPFDLTMLTAEAERYGFYPLELDRYQVIDPLVLDKGIDKYRRGSRKLVDTARHYGIEVDESKAHDAAYDCYLAGMVASKVLAEPELANLPYWRIAERQTAWKRSQAQSLQQYFRSNKNPKGPDPTAVVDGGFPLTEEWQNR